MSDIKAKLESLKNLRGQMKDWKKEDLRKKKNPKYGQEQISEPKDEAEAEGLKKQPEDDSLLMKLLAKLKE